MKVEDKLLIKNLATTANLVNTINGGMAEPITVLEELEDEWLFTLKAPGVSVDNLKVEVKDDLLLIFQNINEDGQELDLPYLIGMLTLSNRVDVDLIYAELEGTEVKIHLPLDQEARRFQREIEIFRK